MPKFTAVSVGRLWVFALIKGKAANRSHLNQIRVRAEAESANNLSVGELGWFHGLGLVGSGWCCLLATKTICVMFVDFARKK
jgi:hypothetical protein